MRYYFIKVMRYDYDARQSVVVKAKMIGEKDLIDFFRGFADGSYSIKIEVFQGEE